MAEQIPPDLERNEEHHVKKQLWRRNVQDMQEFHRGMRNPR